jgi:hypothetical protein
LEFLAAHVPRPGGRDNALAATGQRGRNRQGTDGANRPIGYLRRWWRVRRSIFLCFFFRMRFLRFLINEPIRAATLAADRAERAIPLLADLSGVVQW